MNEAQVRTVSQVRQVLAGTQELQFRAAQNDQERYEWIAAVLRRLPYRRLSLRIFRFPQQASKLSCAALNRTWPSKSGCFFALRDPGKRWTD